MFGSYPGGFYLGSTALAGILVVSGGGGGGGGTPDVTTQPSSVLGAAYPGFSYLGSSGPTSAPVTPPADVTPPTIPQGVVATATSEGAVITWLASIDPGNDTQPPTTPGNLRTTSVAQTSVSLAWNPATDNVGVTAYRVYRDGSIVQTLGNVLAFTDSGRSAATTYNYQVSALDADGNESVLSAVLPVTTLSAGGTVVATPSAYGPTTPVAPASTVAGSQTYLVKADGLTYNSTGSSLVDLRNTNFTGSVLIRSDTPGTVRSLNAGLLANSRFASLNTRELVGLDTLVSQAANFEVDGGVWLIEGCSGRWPHVRVINAAADAIQIANAPSGRPCGSGQSTWDTVSGPNDQRLRLDNLTTHLASGSTGVGIRMSGVHNVRIGGWDPGGQSAPTGIPGPAIIFDGATLDDVQDATVVQALDGTPSLPQSKAGTYTAHILKCRRCGFNANLPGVYHGGDGGVLFPNTLGQRPEKPVWLGSAGGGTPGTETAGNTTAAQVVCDVPIMWDCLAQNTVNYTFKHGGTQPRAFEVDRTVWDPAVPLTMWSEVYDQPTAVRFIDGRGPLGVRPTGTKPALVNKSTIDRAFTLPTGSAGTVSIAGDGWVEIRGVPIDPGAGPNSQIWIDGGTTASKVFPVDTGSGAQVIVAPAAQQAGGVMPSIPPWDGVGTSGVRLKVTAPAGTPTGTTYLIGPTQAVGRRTMADANALPLAPGDTVLFDDSVTWTSYIDPPASGIFGNPITYGKFGGTRVRLLFHGSAAYITGRSYLRFIDIESDMQGVNDACIAVNPAGASSTNVQLIRCHLHNTGTAMALNQTHGVVPGGPKDDADWYLEDCIVEDCGDSGIINYGSRMTLFATADDAMVIRRTGTNVSGPGRHGIYADGPGLRIGMNGSKRVRFELTGPNGSAVSFRAHDQLIGNVLFKQCSVPFSYFPFDPTGIPGVIGIYDCVVDGEDPVSGTGPFLSYYDDVVEPTTGVKPQIDVEIANLTVINRTSPGLAYASAINSGRHVLLRNIAFCSTLSYKIESGITATGNISSDYNSFEGGGKPSYEGVHSIQPGSNQVNATTYRPNAGSPLLNAGTQVVSARFTPPIADIGFEGLFGTAPIAGGGAPNFSKWDLGPPVAANPGEQGIYTNFPDPNGVMVDAALGLPYFRQLIYRTIDTTTNEFVGVYFVPGPTGGNINAPPGEVLKVTAGTPGSIQTWYAHDMANDEQVTLTGVPGVADGTYRMITIAGDKFSLKTLAGATVSILLSSTNTGTYTPKGPGGGGYLYGLSGCKNTAFQLAAGTTLDSTLNLNLGQPTCNAILNIGEDVKGVRFVGCDVQDAELSAATANVKCWLAECDLKVSPLPANGKDYTTVSLGVRGTYDPSNQHMLPRTLGSLNVISAGEATWIADGCRVTGAHGDIWPGRVNEASVVRNSKFYHARDANNTTLTGSQTRPQGVAIPWGTNLPKVQQGPHGDQFQVYDRQSVPCVNNDHHSNGNNSICFSRFLRDYFDFASGFDNTGPPGTAISAPLKIVNSGGKIKVVFGQQGDPKDTSKTIQWHNFNPGAYLRFTGTGNPALDNHNFLVTGTTKSDVTLDATYTADFSGFHAIHIINLIWDFRRCQLRMTRHFDRADLTDSTAVWSKGNKTVFQGDPGIADRVTLIGTFLDNLWDAGDPGPGGWQLPALVAGSVYNLGAPNRNYYRNNGEGSTDLGGSGVAAPGVMATPKLNTKVSGT